MGIERLFETVRQPAYTGENRCAPCTLVNLLLAGIASAALAVVSPVVGAAAFAASALVVYLRGYLVPGTPALTERYLPASVLDLFGKAPSSVDRAPSDLAPAGPSGEADPLDRFGAVDRDAGGDRRLAPEFRRAWNDVVDDIDAADVEREAVAAALGVETDDVSAVGPAQFFVSGERLVQWPSEPALVADAAAGSVLAGRPSWDDLGVDDRLDALATLRALRRDCPACGAALVRDEETVESCCQPPVNVVVASCEACDVQIAEKRVR
ncbi:MULTISPECIES: hypothetical protein [Halorussus]|uniref:hypothetical protein n=1 Tax=Halorussus TaxID=1070314 RepID=UPI000E20F6A4|nr:MULTISPECIES: hypothetical protein [Halorussus]NHN57729.1 hypothetical protein [Halorussus sp. JP-T4]